MPDPTDDVELPQATVVRPKRSRISIVWIIPVLAVLVGIGIAVQRIRAEGPTITIVFRAAEGIEAGKTFIKYKDVIIGVPDEDDNYVAGAGKVWVGHVGSARS